ncbi:phytoene desaturase family protein [Paractinoplanes rishiriensis]|uniref:Pyridine nucleotide-disulfide oxidoreductase domain-containing protein 2 n=1 Tax=Paractinoplanes rishiriensis TaxID=1050105 RepID=A0A919MTH5_9ACTN|nr:NAD(P)/FAD-dependent oxidoreductase [Actinoplanes rishiriensis]GIE94269.1 beta-carotene ketolase [Actinoplanes rishiriensis]
MGMPEEVDVVVVGAGHNGLICAAYLASAGLDVAVLEARPIPGGNTVTEELTLPGFAHDSCSSAHVLIQSNPLLADDELELVSRWGLEYVHTDPAVVLPRDDGSLLTVHRSLDATADEIARWSAADAVAFRQLVEEWQGGLAEVHGRWSSGFDLGSSAAAAAYRDLRARSAWDVVHERFGHPAVRDLMLWLSLATIQDPRRPGTGVLPSSITAGRLRFGWSTPLGGSGALPAALIRLLTDRGGVVECDAVVNRIEVRDGRAVAVHTADGRRVAGRRAVVAANHLATLPGMLERVPGDLDRARAAWRPGLSVFAVHAALGSDLTFSGVRAAAAGLGGTEGIARQLDAFHRGQTDATDPWLLLVNQTVVDPSRAPAGAGTFKILTVAPWERADGRDWSVARDFFADELLGLVAARTNLDILAQCAESPVDVAAHNQHNLGGSCHGGEFAMDGGEWLVGWPDYATSIDGLYLTGSTSHPGGSVSGRPGRNAARAVLTGLGLDPAVVMGPR